MKIDCLQDNLNSGLSLLGKSIAKKSTLPVLECVKVSTDNGRMLLETTNLDMTVRVWVGACVELDGSICVPYAPFSKMIGVLSPERLIMESVQRTMSPNVSCGATIAEFSGIDGNDFPIIPEQPEDDDYITINVHDFMAAVNAVEFCAADDSNRPVLTGINLIFGEDRKLNVVATDGFYLGHKRIDVSKATANYFDVILDSSALKDVIWILGKVYGKENDSLFIRVVHNEIDNDSLPSTVLISGSNFEIILRSIEGRFPNYRQLYPKNTPTKIVIDAEMAVTALKRVDAMLNKSQVFVTLETESDKAVLYFKAESDGNKQQTILDATIQGNSIKVDTFRARLAKIASFIANKKLDNRITLNVSGNGNMILITCKRDPELTYLLMNKIN